MNDIHEIHNIHDIHERTSPSSQSSSQRRYDSGVGFATNDIESEQSDVLKELIESRLSKVGSNQHAPSINKVSTLDKPRVLPSPRDIANQLELLRTGDCLERDVHRCLDRSGRETSLAFWTSSPPCLASSHSKLLDSHCILSEHGLEGLIRLSEDVELANALGAWVDFKKWHEELCPTKFPPSVLKKQYDFAQSLALLHLLSEALANFKRHNEHITVRIFNERPLLTDSESRRKCCGLHLYDETLLRVLPVDSGFTLEVIAVAVWDTEYPLRRLSLQYGLTTQRAGTRMTDIQEVLRLNCFENKGSIFFG
ncbi:hypothetical protein D6D28_09717 [Aureobasidium pullulans]|uniref:Uncharacterized protein n=1 Tax=Aureobasidium pullulans TaxID=5580 RepID=A0A4S8S3M7_AURPU|nr:hypothetical protein D6D28_09717 [Aureobasidium pullulans]